MAGDPRIERTRQRVLDAAWELLTEVGFDGVTIELVSLRSGVARSTLYRHWHTKSEMLRDAFSTVAQAQHQQAAPSVSPRERLAAYAAHFAEGLTGLWGRAALTLSVSAFDDPAQRAVQQIFIQGNRRDLEAILEAAIAEGELAESPDVDALVDQLEERVIAPLFYRYIFTQYPANAADAHRIANAAWDDITRTF